MARATTSIPTKLMTKKAGPSPESAKAYSRPQTSHCGLSERKPLNRLPRPQRGQRPRSPVEIGGGGDRSYSTASLLLLQGGGRLFAQQGQGEGVGTNSGKVSAIRSEPPGDRSAKHKGRLQAALQVVTLPRLRQCPPALAPAPQM